MCFYSSNSKRAMAVAKRYGLKTDIIEMAQQILEEQKYRIQAFTHPLCPIVTANESLQAAQWGLIPSWTKTAEDAKKIRNMTLNARSETVFQLPSFRSPIQSKRCLFPCTGYFEFHHSEKGKKPAPWYIFLKDEEIFSIAGMYDHWRNPATGEITQTFTILTVPANELCAEIHNGGKNPFRMPLIIAQENEKHWLDASLKNTDIQQFFQPFDAGKMDAYPISKDFLKKLPDDASVIEQAA
jgi:putative SOS response-associated peptidase YedK